MALSTSAKGLARPAALLLLPGVEVELLPPAVPDLVPDVALPVMELSDDVSVELAVLVRVAMLMVVLRIIAVPVPAEAAVPPMVVVGMLEFKLATMELTVWLRDATTELTEALDMATELT